MALSLPYLLVSSLILGSDFAKAQRPQLWFCSPRKGPQAGFTQSGALPPEPEPEPEPKGLNLLSEGRTSRKCWCSLGSVCGWGWGGGGGSRLLAACWSHSRPRWLQATGWMTQVGCAGQTSWYSHPSRVTTVISSPVITVPPPSGGGLARPGARYPRRRAGMCLSRPVSCCPRCF